MMGPVIEKLVVASSSINTQMSLYYFVSLYSTIVVEM